MTDPEHAARVGVEKPIRIQRKRTKGWKMPEDAVYVGRPTKWGNPSKWKDCPPYIGSPAWARGAAVREFKERIFGCGEPLRFTCDDAKAELRGRALVCWCPLNHPCHADVLLEIANAE